MESQPNTQDIEINTQGDYRAVLLLISDAQLHKIQQIFTRIQKQILSIINRWAQLDKLSIHGIYLPVVMNFLYSKIEKSNQSFDNFQRVNSVLKAYVQNTKKQLYLIPIQRLIEEITQRNVVKKASFINDYVLKMSIESCTFPNQCLCCCRQFYEEWDIDPTIKRNKIIGASQVDSQKGIKGINSINQLLNIQNKQGGVIFINPTRYEEKMMGTYFYGYEKEKLFQKLSKWTSYFQNKGFKIKIQFVHIVESLFKAKQLKKDKNKRRCEIPRIVVSKKNFKASCIRAKQYQGIENKTGLKYYRTKDKTFSIFRKKDKVLQFDFVNGFPKVQKKYQSMVIVATKERIKFFKAFQEILAKSNASYTLTRAFPYKSEREARMFYLLSHDEKYLELRNLKRKADPDDILSFFHATKNLRLPSRYNEVYLDIFASEFEQAFQQQFETKRIVVKLDDRKITHEYLIFKRIEHAIFGFIYLQQFMIKATFIRDIHIRKQQ